MAESYQRGQRVVLIGGMDLGRHGVIVGIEDEPGGYGLLIEVTLDDLPGKEAITTKHRSGLFCREEVYDRGGR